MRTLLAALKLAFFAASTFGLFAVWWTGNLVVPNKVYWRQVFFGWWAKSFVIASRMKLEVVGTPPRAPFFLVTNHLSYADIPALRTAVPCVFVAKGEIEGWAVIGRMVRDMAGTIFIDRQNRRDIPRAGELIMERLGGGEGVVIFPEGTSTKGERVEPFHSSFFEFAVQERLPVSYAALTYKTPAGELEAHDAVCWWEDIGFFAHMWRLLKVRGYTTVITFGASPVAGTDRKTLAQELHDRVEEKFTPVL